MLKRGSSGLTRSWRPSRILIGHDPFRARAEHGLEIARTATGGRGSAISSAATPEGSRVGGSSMADSPRAPLGVDGEKFGEVAVREKFSTPEQVSECVELQERILATGSPHRRLGDLLVEKGYLTAGQADAIARLIAARSSAAHSSSKMIATVGFRIPGYELLERIGQGAMGSVFKARQLSMDRIVAVKVLNLKRGGDPNYIERFEREARSVGQLNHANIIQGIEVGEANGLHYLVMEYVDGEPISSLLHREGPMGEKRCLQIALQVARALDHAARHGVIHRDVKPENLMLTRDGIAKLCDLGLAKQTRQGGANLTMEGITVGTPNYISPEQARGESDIDARSDIYSLGATLYHMATGVPPFDGPNPMAIMTKHVTDPVDPPIRRVPGLSQGFNNLILKSLMKRREDRYQDARLLLADLQLLLKGGQVAAPRTATRRVAAASAPLPRPPRRSSRLPYVLASCGAVVAIVGAIWILRKGVGKTVADPSAPAGVPDRPPKSGDGAADSARCEQEMKLFREYCEVLRENKERAWIRRIYERGEQRLRDYGHTPFEADWIRLVAESRAEIDGFIGQTVWKPICEEANRAREKRDFARAVEIVHKLDEEYVYFRREGGEVLTKSGEAQRHFLGELLDKEIPKAYQEDKNEITVLWTERKYEDAFRGLAGMARRYGGGEDLLNLREQVLRSLIESILTESPTPERYVEAQERIRSLQSIFAQDADFVRLIVRSSEELKTRASDAAFEAAVRLPEIYQKDIAPVFGKALAARDLVAARRLLYEVYFGDKYATVRGPLLPDNLDFTLVRSLLDPHRAAPAEYGPVLTRIEEAAQAARVRGVGVAFEIHLDLRAYALLEELIEQAVRGARLFGMDESKFAGFEGALKGVVGVEMADRKEGDPWRFRIKRFAPTGGFSEQDFHLAPIGKDLNATEEDISLLSKKSYAGGHENDPYFSLRSGLLYLYKERGVEDSELIEKVKREPAIFAIGRYRDRLKEIPSLKIEEKAAFKYETAVRLYTDGKKSEALKALQELRDHYATTAFLSSETDERTGEKLPKSRIQFVLDCIGKLEADKKKPRIEDLFRGVTKRLAGGRVEVAYDFVSHAEGMEDFKAANWIGVIFASKSDRGGVRLNGNAGFWYWKALLENNVTLKINVRIGNDQGVGAVLHGSEAERGYLGFVDFQPQERTLQDWKGQSLLMRLPVQKLADLPNSVFFRKRTARVQKGEEVELLYARDGKSLTLSAGGVEAASCPNGLYDGGQAGVFVWGSDVVVQKIVITGKPVESWVERELKNLEK